MSSAELLQRRTSAVELVSAGHSYDEVAEVLGYANRSGAWKAVQAPLRAREGEIVDEYRQLNLKRLDALLATVWDDAMHGDLKALAEARRIVDSQSRLTGYF
jgi:hypothetical protein